MRRLLLALSFALAMMGLVIVGSVGGNGLPQVGFQADSVSVAEDAGHIDLTVSLSTSSTLTVTVDYATQEGSALAGQDFLSAAGTVTFTPGITLGAISIFLLDDALPEQVESFSVVLTDTQNAALGLHPTMTVTITGDSDLYTVLLPLVWRPVPAPILYPIGNADGDGNYTVTWSAVPMAEFYMLQEDDNPAFSSPVERVSRVSDVLECDRQSIRHLLLPGEGGQHNRAQQWLEQHPAGHSAAATGQCLRAERHRRHTLL